MMSQLKLCFFISCLFLSFNMRAETEIPKINDLRILKQQMHSSNLPVLIMLTTQDCNYCELVRKNYLIPMVNSGDYKSKILFRQLYIEDFSYIRDEKGLLIGGDSIALKYDVDITPTILFVNAEWVELTDRIIGINNRDYFDRILTSSISKAEAAMLELN